MHRVVFIFNILNNKFYFNSLSVLDLFAGIGSISFEFASRGTEDITCVDQHYNSLKFIQKTAREFDLDIKTIKSDVFKYLEKTNLKHDIIFADPPYDFSKEQFVNIIALIVENNLLNESGIVIIEHSKRTDLSDIKNFSYSKKYGGSMFSFFEK